MNLVPAFQQIASEVKDRFTYRYPEYISILRREGYLVIPDYWAREDVEQIASEMLQHLRHGNDQERAGRNYGKGIIRISDADKFCELARKFLGDRLILHLAAEHLHCPIESETLLYQYNPPNTTTRGYHLDGYLKEFKAFLYLTDVDMESGPLCFVPRSHTWRWYRTWRHLRGGKTDLDAALTTGGIPITGNAGTLILFDARGAHRGMDQNGKERAVLVNYLMRRRGK